MSAILQETALAGELQQILAEDRVRSVYQPIVDLDSAEVVGYEALARGPAGSSLERPDRLFATAHACGLVAEQENPSPAIAAIVHAVNAQSERSGAVLLAEGIETPEQLEVARALGARYGQGWLFGRPGELPTDTTPLAAPLAPRHHAVPAPESPFEAVAARLRPRRGTKQLLLAISKHLEAQVVAQGEAAVVLASFQEARHFTPRSAARYERLAGSAALAGALGVGLPAEPARGVRGAALAAADALAGEWDVVVIAPHFAAAFVARDLGDTPDEDMARRFDFCLTYDRDLAIEAARGLLARVAPAS
jgi:hypothetical protein